MKYNKIEKSHYIIFDFSEDYDFDYLKEAFFVIQTECEEHQINKVVIDCSKVLNIFNTEMERYFISEEIVKHLGYRIKLAIIGKKDQINYFGENVAVNRGANMKVFSNSDIALEWLFK